MTDQDRPSPGAEGHWSEWEQIEDGGEPTLETVAVAKCGDEWSCHAVVYAGVDEDDQTEYLIVVRSRVGDTGALILSERYLAVPADLEELEDARWLGNGIDRRVNGRIGTALMRAYARVSNDTLAGTDKPPALLDATVGEDQDPVDTDVLDSPIEELQRARARDEDREVVEGDDGGAERRTHGAKESVDLHAGARRDTEVCVECGQPVDKEHGRNLGAALGSDQWVHEDACPTDDEDDQEGDEDDETAADGGDMVACPCGAKWHREAGVGVDPCPACSDGGEGS